MPYLFLTSSFTLGKALCSQACDRDPQGANSEYISIYGETHTLVVPDDVEEMMTLFHVTGGYTYVDPYGTTLAVEDVFTKIGQARKHFEAIGLGADYVNNFIR